MSFGSSLNSYKSFSFLYTKSLRSFRIIFSDTFLYVAPVFLFTDISISILSSVLFKALISVMVEFLSIAYAPPPSKSFFSSASYFL